MLHYETIKSDRLYNRIEDSYDRVFERAILAKGRLTIIVRNYMDGRSVLELTCGKGRWLKRFVPAEYVGVGLNEKMLEHAKRRFHFHTFVRADTTDLPFDDGRFEGVVSLFGAMGHLLPKGQRKAIKES